MDGALAAQIQAGKKLKKAQTNDRSTPIVPGGAPRTGTNLPSAPRPPGLKNSNGIPKNSNNNSQHAGSTAVGPPQLGGLFTGGIPTLKKTNTASSNSAPKSAPPVPKPPAFPPSRAPPPAPPVANTQTPHFSLPPPIPPQTTTSNRPPPPPPVAASSASSRPPPPRPPSALSPLHSKSQSVSRQNQISSSNPPAPPPRPHTSNAVRPPPLPSRPGSRVAPPPPPPRTTHNSPNLGGSLNRKKPPPPPPRPSLNGSLQTTFSDIHEIQRTASTPPVLSKHVSSVPNPNHLSPPGRPPPPISRAQETFTSSPPSNGTPRPIATAPGPLHQPSPSSVAPLRSSNFSNRNRVLSTPSAPEEAGITQSSVSHGSPRPRAKSMIFGATLAPSSNRPPSPPVAFSINPPRNFPPSSTFPPPRKFQSGITHQYPSTRKQGCDWDYKAILT